MLLKVITLCFGISAAVGVYYKTVEPMRGIKIYQKPKISRNSINKYNKTISDARWLLLKNLFKINMNNYIDVNKRLMDKFCDGKLNGYNDLNFRKDVLMITEDFRKSYPRGIMYPYILFKKDKTEVLFMYLDKNNKGIMQKYTKLNNGTWNKKVYRK